ncbi:bifunctional phosphopantothenoylcysteine decarboxylase/phosphopantothenate synthase [Ruania halotolerans]|uniref:bifunctional phosphopantothenoylcysteine decarboxylase/phosphopantothenate synthase n=1 Tax=Ruania halotolerans TaxID=2897773 RepID=UPI001E3DC568|nr:bifunctional phosphopantothenoylcysteine decarboxylase/phosphopantothenate synthase [Ruania halotolerans]UFU04723.1 bifunctional phosphopantothenoylcysteine decarboxylase/phosphopantothenate synthase [Ruania halotolerans]
MRILLGVSGGIAAYKVPVLLRSLREDGHAVRVIPTRAALQFVGAPTWEALSAEPVTTSVFDGADTVDHVRLGRAAELVIVAPATADLLARAAAGIADDLLTATLLTVTCPVLMAPAMHTEMWQHPATRANVALLRERGVHVLDPAVGRLTGADTGPGRMPEPEDLMRAVTTLLAEGTLRDDSADGPGQHDSATQQNSETEQDLTGLRVTISAGGTREYLDPVRFLGNRSSGRQGIALARAAARRGADVELVAANIDASLLPDGVHVSAVETTAELAEAMHRSAPDAHVLVMAAAVADFRPATANATKTKKTDDGVVPPLELVQNPDILASLVQDRRPGQVVVGFAAETGDAHGSVLEHGRAKALRKGADLLAVNAVGTDQGFGDVPNAVHLLDADGTEVVQGSGSKDDVAAVVWDAVVNLLRDRDRDRAGAGGGDGSAQR